MKAKRKYPEAALQRAVVQWLKLAGVENLMYFAIPNGMVSDARSVANMKSQGLRPGVADLEIIPPFKRACFLELKSPNGTLTDVQIKFGNDCLKAGIKYEVAHNIDDAISILNAWGALRPEMLGKWGQSKKLAAS